MKNTLLLKASALSAVSVLVVGAAVVPFTSFASESSRNESTRSAHAGQRLRMNAEMHGAYGLVTAVQDSGDGTGTITVNLRIPEEQDLAPTVNDSILEKMKEHWESFFSEHPDAPQPGDDLTLAYDSDTRFFVGGEDVSASAITVGMTVHVAGVTTDGEQAVRAVSDSPRPLRGEGGRFRSHGVIGEVLSVDTDANTVTISVPDESDDAFAVGADVRVGAMMHDRE